MVFLNSYLTIPPRNANEPTILRFIWANKRHVIVCLMMFVISGAMSICDLESVVPEEMVNFLPLQSAAIRCTTMEKQGS